MTTQTTNRRLKQKVWTWRIVAIIMSCLCCVLIVSNNRISREKENDEKRYLKILELRDSSDKQMDKLTATINNFFEHRRVETSRDLDKADAKFQAQLPTLMANRLLKFLEDRQSWPSNSVKIWLANPMVRVTLSLPGQKPVLIHAWSKNSSDFEPAMMRLDEGEKLYQITDEEFRLLKQLQTSDTTSQSN